MGEDHLSQVSPRRILFDSVTMREIGAILAWSRYSGYCVIWLAVLWFQTNPYRYCIYLSRLRAEHLIYSTKSNNVSTMDERVLRQLPNQTNCSFPVNLAAYRMYRQLYNFSTSLAWIGSGRVMSFVM